MALSDHEQRLLDEMERNLYQHDAEFVAQVASIRPRPSVRHLLWGALLAVAGIAIVIGAVMTHLALLGVVGFVALVAGVMLAIRTPSRAAAGSAAGSASAGRSRPSSGRQSFMDRVNERWNRRQDS
ncbi:MAG: DUF3040 domain-containing protein [Microbacteriaceae bacterium]